ncbi:MAG: PilZ domain-containing protein [Candidatus Omnitrophica bacterium]|nr:PilZ domain-containing protein [Candidatus Omnitrophota bacterium]MDE2009604.1 PilZ domain-containing protein [Candidatus Omnitrophota bacterium]MDE2214468.1 PilZ domain-containing protein [Candidatus Omnitrophota bacterium]MDE2231608.1 PilZ domain-containing protein [Candidatus Omnitrophota bacterium]
MVDNQRRYRRIEKPIHILFCAVGAASQRWDMSIIQNISSGGIKFPTSNGADLNNKTLLVKINFQELLPRRLELKAKVLSSKLRPNTKIFDVRAQFIDVSEEQRNDLFLMEQIIDQKK